MLGGMTAQPGGTFYRHNEGRFRGSEAEGLGYLVNLTLHLCNVSFILFWHSSSRRTSVLYLVQQFPQSFNA